MTELNVCRWARLRFALLGTLAAVWLQHSHYMLLRKFDYGWNMQLCLALGLCQSVAWVVWAHATGHPARCVEPTCTTACCCS